MSENQNAALWFVDRHLSEGRKAKVVFQEADGAQRTLTYGGLAVETSLFAGALTRAGIRREERMAMLVRDQIEFPVAFWGALKAGVIPIPLNTLLSTAVYQAILSDSRATMLVVSAELWDTVAPALAACPDLKTIVVIGAKPEDATTDLENFMSGAVARDAVLASGDDTAFWLYSSGSTACPKACVMSTAA